MTLTSFLIFLDLIGQVNETLGECLQVAIETKHLLNTYFYDGETCSRLAKVFIWIQQWRCQFHVISTLLVCKKTFNLVKPTSDIRGNIIFRINCAIRKLTYLSEKSFSVQFDGVLGMNNWLYESKYSIMDQVKFVEDSL